MLYVPDPNFTERIEKTKVLFQSIADFSLNDSDIESKNNLCERIRYTFHLVFNEFSNYVPTLALLDLDDASINEIIQRENHAREISERTIEHFEETKIKVDKIVAAIQELSAKAGVGNFSGEFLSQAEKLAKSSTKWLGLTVLLAIGTFVMAGVFLYFPQVNQDSISMIVQQSISKVVMLGLLFSATIWSGKQFRALKHQESINLHRAHALKSFQAFVQAADDIATKEAVLLETTRSIFAIANSGYLANTDSVNGDNLKIIEMIRGQTSNSSS